MVVEVEEASQAQNGGDCKVPNAFLLGALGCNIATTYSADACVVEYDLNCVRGTHVDIDVRQVLDDSIVGTLHKYDPSSDCTLDLDITMRPGPTSTPTAEDGQT